MHMELTAEQADVLINVLETEASDLRMEIAHTDSARFKADLRNRKEVLTSLLHTLHDQAGV